MSIRTCLKTVKTTRIPSHRLREIPPSISKNLNPTSPATAAADFSDLSPSKLLQILSDPAVKPAECFQFFNSVIENQSAVSFVPDLNANLTLIGRLLKGKRFAEVEHLLKSLIVDQNGRYPFPVVASSVENLENLKSSVVAKLFNVMMNVYSVNGLFDQVVESFDYMERNRVGIDERTCTLHLILLKKSGEMKLVMEFFHRMIRSGIEISPYSLAVVVSGLCENGEVRMCREFVGEMIRNRVKPNVVTYNIMLNACIRRWNFAELELILGLMKKEETNCEERTYRMLIDGYASCGKFEEAERMALEMNGKGFGHGGGGIHIWNLILSGYCKKGFVEKAASLFDKMNGRGVAPNADTYHELIGAHCRAGNVEGSMVYVSKMVKNGFDVDEATLSMLLIDGFCSKGMASEACDFLVEMIGSGRVVVDVSICSEVGRRLCVLNRFDKAKVLVDMMAAANDAASLATEISEEVSKPDDEDKDGDRRLNNGNEDVSKPEGPTTCLQCDIQELVAGGSFQAHCVAPE